MENTLIEMLNDRGIFDIEKYEHHWICHNNSTKVLVFFVKEIKVCIKKIKELNELVNDEISYVILVYNSNITSFARNAIKNEIIYPVQLFMESELMFNITKHALVPKHEIVSNKDKTDFFTRNNFKPKNLPRIYDNDPVVKYHYGKPGDLVKIVRKSETTGESLYYRLVYSY